jgi:hypothetical protein
MTPYAVKFRDTAQTTKRLFEAERPVGRFPTVAETSCHSVRTGSGGHKASYATDKGDKYSQE